MALTNGANLGVLDNGNAGEQHYTELMRFFRTIDTLVQPHVKSATTTTPPVSPSEGDAYIIPAASTGAWSSNIGKIARWSSRIAVPAWEFITPKKNWILAVDDDATLGKTMRYNGSAWVADASAGSEPSSNKVTNFSTVNDVLFPTVQAVKTYVDGSVAGLLDDRGTHNASGNTWPSTGGSGVAGAIMKGDLWYIGAAGTLGGVAVVIGDSIRALTDAPGTTASNWAILEGNLGFVPENSASKNASGGYVGLTGFNINFRNVANTFTSLFTNTNTAARTYTFPDRDGTIATSVGGSLDNAPIGATTPNTGKFTTLETTRIVGIGTAHQASVKFTVGGGYSGGTQTVAIGAYGTIDPAVSTIAHINYVTQNTVLAGTLATLYDYYASSGTYTGSVNNHTGFYASSFMAGTNIRGFVGNIAAGTGKYNLYMTGTADNYLAGKLGIGAVPLSSRGLTVSTDQTSSIATIGAFVTTNILSDVTSQARGFCSQLSTQAASFTLAALIDYQTVAGTKGASSTVTNHYGFLTAAGWGFGSTGNFSYYSSDLTGATNNFGYYSVVTAATGKWNFYAAGSANNAFAGNSSFGKVTAPSSAVDTTSFATSIVTNAAATYTWAATDSSVIQTTTASTHTLPAAASFTGRILRVVTQFAGAVISAAANVIPLAGGAAQTAILAATAGKWAKLQSNGTNWVIIAAN